MSATMSAATVLKIMLFAESDSTSGVNPPRRSVMIDSFPQSVEKTDQRRKGSMGKSGSRRWNISLESSFFRTHSAAKFLPIA
jgi:hypothetical protein